VSSSTTKYRPWMLKVIEQMCKLGAIDTEIAKALDVSVKTIYSWKKSQPEFCKVLKAAKSIADDQVVKSLYSRANGYSHPEEKAFQYLGKPIIVPMVKHYPPDTAACIFWLKNRKPNEWRDKQEIQHSGDLEVYAAEKAKVEDKMKQGGLLPDDNRNPLAVHGNN